ncbi:hypothetical protein [Sphingomonas changnyeongensis]|uniref:hypothetical protein n=1 Tax=Sphingomonas changnyeongensis TaxID=2698679 RepID=UPI001E5F0169|nr:hypothetical protein [Sphingomonas changnyeongensis]
MIGDDAEQLQCRTRQIAVLAGKAHGNIEPNVIAHRQDQRGELDRFRPSAEYEHDPGHQRPRMSLSENSGWLVLRTTDHASGKTKAG